MPIFPVVTIKSQVTFTNEAGAVFDPTIVRCSVRNPLGTVTTIAFGGPELFPPSSMEQVSTGVYALFFDISTPGRYTFSWYGEAANGIKTTQAASIEISSTDLGS